MTLVWGGTGVNADVLHCTIGDDCCVFVFIFRLFGTVMITGLETIDFIAI